MRFNKLNFVVFLVAIIFSTNISSQNLERIMIEEMECSIVIPEQCSPEDMIVVINSSLQNLKFESNMLPDDAFTVIHNSETNQYIICHERIKFKLTIKGPNLQSEEIEVFNIDKPLCFRVSANTAKGTVNILTNPRNATAIFPDLNNTVLSTNQPITNISGKYRVNIVKPQYKSVDTVIVIPRDAEKTYNIELEPLFSRIKLDLKTDDNTLFAKAPIIWIDSVKIELEALVKAGTNQRSFFDDVELLKFYEGNIIPLKEGIYSIKIEAESYIPYKTTIQVKKGELRTLSVSLEPIFGYLTFIDKQFSEGASILINDQNIGKVPLFKVKTRVGNHIIKFEKAGFIPVEKEYKVQVQENQSADIEVSMLVAKKIVFESEPSNAEILMNGSRIGFTPFSATLTAGTHEMLIRKSGFASEKLTKLINESTPDEETIKINLRSISPLNIQSEKEGLFVKLEGKDNLKNVEVENTNKTPVDISVPFGKYKISLTDNSKIYYKGIINHSPEIQKRGKLPSYSRSSFITLSGYYENENSFEASFGRSVIFPRTGLSTAIINVDYKVIPFETDSMIYSFKTIAPYIFFLNWDWRIGGSVLRQLDVNLIGRAKYTPGLKVFSTNIPEYSDVEMQNYFYGFEISTRLSYFNVCFRYGREINKGKVNYWSVDTKEYIDMNFPINNQRNVATIGLSLNGKVYKSNTMLRVWNKPLIDLSKRKLSVNDSQKNMFHDFFSKINVFNKSDKTK
jgi:hypothetical protein